MLTSADSIVKSILFYSSTSLGESMLAGMDVDQPHNQAVRTAFNITGFPTIMYFEKGNLKFKYGGENNKEGIVSWMRDPSPPKV